MNLPSDLLVDIFLLVDTHDISQKFDLSQVCLSWRTTALSASSLWARIAVKTPLDAQRLSIVLDRSASQFLDVQLLWQYRYKEALLSNDERFASSAALVKHLQRIKRLFVTYERDRSDGLPCLLASGLTFPALEDLKVTGPFDRDFHISLTAPRLRRLVLENQHIAHWDGLLVSSLLHFEARNCHPNGSIELLHPVFDRCPALEHVSLDTLDDGFTNFATPVGPALTTLDLRADPTDVTSILRSGFPGRRLRKIRTCTINGDVDDEMKEMLAEVLRGLDSVRRLVMHYDQDLEIFDVSGRSRRLEVWNEDSTWEWPAFWLQLAELTSAHTTLEIIQIRASDWTRLATSFAAHEPAMNALELHVLLDDDSVEDTVFNEDEEDYEGHLVMHRLVCPPLRKIIFGDSGYEGESRDALVRKLLQNIDSADEVVEICLFDARITGDELEMLLKDVPQLRARGVWTICAHCIANGLLARKKMIRAYHRLCTCHES